MAQPPTRSSSPRRRSVATVLIAALTVAGCGGPETIIVSSLIEAAVRTAIDQAQKNRTTPEQEWHAVKLASLERRADAGDPEAQFQMGTYYQVARNPAARGWICRAANQGHAKAQLQYGHWFNEDRSREDLFPFIEVTPNNATAYMWYDMAASNGEPRATHFRDNLVSAGMRAETLQRGQARVASWTPDACADAAIAAAGMRVVGTR